MKHIKPYNVFENNQESNHSGFPETVIEIENWCEQFEINNYTINDDLSINVQGSVHLHNKDLSYIPLNFNYVSSHFTCGGNELSSLKGCPIKVDGIFSCVYNELKTLEYAPQYVGSHFECNNNIIDSLIGGPKEVYGDYDCSNNELKSLQGIAERVRNGIGCAYNNLTDLNYLTKNFTALLINDNPIYSIVKIMGNETKSEIYHEFNEYSIVRGDKVVLNRLKAFCNDFGFKIPDLDKVKEYYTIV